VLQRHLGMASCLGGLNLSPTSMVASADSVIRGSADLCGCKYRANHYGLYVGLHLLFLPTRGAAAILPARNVHMRPPPKAERRQVFGSDRSDRPSRLPLSRQRNPQGRSPPYFSQEAIGMAAALTPHCHPLRGIGALASTGMVFAS
jgi:hypothetical protein